MSARLDLVKDIETLPSNLIDEVVNYVAFLKYSKLHTEKSAPVRPKPKYNCLAGQIWISDDFDEEMDFPFFTPPKASAQDISKRQAEAMRRFREEIRNCDEPIPEFERVSFKEIDI
ncbi:MAG: DUF2281 domain-containing protein [Oscillospiraceae bacterium]|nr:DUF2281 domain-containing protein [Oscillospiraceae bacterium]